MKKIVALLFCWVLMATDQAAVCQAVGVESPIEEGISQALAEHRRAQIRQLAYALTFHLPADREEAIQATETIRLTLEAPGEIVLDFREPDKHVQQVRVNGQPCAWMAAADHLVIPRQLTQAGENLLSLDFTAGSQSLNRREDYLYTLFVPDRAHTAFPCFDQPDLKASFSLTLEMPEAWKAVSNGPVLSDSREGGRRRIAFAATEPLPTYLFAFAAGEFQYQYFAAEKLGAYYRETDTARVAQLPEIARQIAFSIDWLEQFTGVPYPFAKYDFVVLPGFQFGGMEHTGATFYNDNTLFLSAHPTPDELLHRTELIAHETAHMWFGDAVTMQWFNDVWTKEVFANYFAAEITAPLFPEVNHSLNWLKTYVAAAVSQDRTEGRTPIRQPLDNMRNAGLVYNTIIYNKAPVMMRKMVDLMGRDAFQRGIQHYVAQYKYGNATWDDLIDLLDRETPADLRSFSRTWVDEEYWPQRTASSCLEGRDASFYGYLELSAFQTDSLMHYWPGETDPTARQALLMNLYENYCTGRIGEEPWLSFLTRSLQEEQDMLTASTLIGYLSEPMQLLRGSHAEPMEESLWQMATDHSLPSVRTQLLRLLIRRASSESIVQRLYDLWQTGSDPRLSVNDFMTLTYELSIRMPEQAERLIALQRERIDNPDRLRQFDFVARAVVPSEAARDTLFASLSDVQARKIEPWTLSVLYYLNHPMRDEQSVKYIRPALELLPEIQRTGDIFFPGNWSSNLLAGHRSKEAAEVVRQFLASHPELHPMLRKKVQAAAYFLYRACPSPQR